MENSLKNSKKAREVLKEGVADKLLLQKPFLQGMYRFSMFMIDYYARVKEHLDLDYDSFMIIQTTVSHNLYNINRANKRGASYKDLETEWDKILNTQVNLLEAVTQSSINTEQCNKLTISSVCLVTKLPKETVRRKVNVLAKRSLVKISKKNGITLGSAYGKVFKEFVPTTAMEVSKFLRSWDKSGVLKNILNFHV
jgi:hypothetical protein